MKQTFFSKPLFNRLGKQNEILVIIYEDICKRFEILDWQLFKNIKDNFFNELNVCIPLYILPPAPL